jgi:hypothetical protein
MRRAFPSTPLRPEPGQAWKGIHASCSVNLFAAPDRTGSIKSAGARLIALIGRPSMTRTLQEYEWVAAK